RSQDFGMGQMDSVAVAECRVVVERESLTDLKRLLALGELPHAQLGPLQVGQYADRPAYFPLDLADALHQCAHEFVIGMAHIDAEDICPRLEKPLQHRLFRRGRTDGGKNLDLAAAS